jgi:hypothetical protein
LTTSSTAAVISAPLSALGSVSSNLGLDVWLPTTLTGQSWKGALQAFLNSSTLGLYTYALPQFDMGSLTPGQFSHVTIAMPSDVVTKLSSSGYTDLTVTLSFGLADTANLTYVDKLDFGVGGGSDAGAGGAGVRAELAELGAQ